MVAAENVVAIGFNYDLGAGKRGGAAVIAELPDTKERIGGDRRLDRGRWGCTRFSQKGR